MKDIIKLCLLFFAAICFVLACNDNPGNYTRTQERDTLMSYEEAINQLRSGQVSPAALRTVGGLSWRFWRLTDSTFALMSQDTTGMAAGGPGLETIVREDSIFAWFMTKLPDSLDLASYNDTLRVSNDTLYITGQTTGFFIGGSSGGVSKKSATYTIASSTGLTDSADYYCDGTADQVQIQAAIDALPAEGGSIQLREGQFNLSSSVQVPSSKKILISGTVGTVISVSTGDTAFYASNPDWVGHGNQEDLIIEKIRFEGPGSNAVAVHLNKRHVATIQNCVFVGDSLTGISITQTNNVKILSNFFNRCKRAVIGLCGATSGEDIEDITISQNDFSYVGREAIRLVSTNISNQRYVSKINIVGNNIEEADFDRLGSYAIYLGYNQGTVISNNSISQTYRGGGIWMDNSRLCVISSNHFAQNGINQVGGDTVSTIFLAASDKNLITANTVTNETVDYGITMNGTSDDNQVSYNRIDLSTEANRYRDFGLRNNIIKTETGVVQFDLGTTDGFELQYDKSSTSGAFFISRSGGGSNAGFIGYAHGGTTESPTATLANKYLALISGRGHDGTAFSTGAKGYFGVRAGGNWSGSDNETEIIFATTDNNSTTTTQRMLIHGSGSVSIGTADPATSATLDIQGTTGGLLLPRLTTTQRNSLTGTAGLMIFNTTLDSVQCYTGAGWRSL